MKTKITTPQILRVMHILAWVAFVGLLIEAGAILLSYAVSWFNPDAAKNLYKGLNLHALRQFNFWHYTLAVSFMIVLAMMKAFISFLVIKTLSKVNLRNPFTEEVVHQLEKISYVLLGTWLVAMAYNAHTALILKLTGAVQGNWVNGEFIFMAGLVFVITQIFKRGVELQSENDLTV